MASFCLGIAEKKTARRERYRERLAVRVRQIMKQIFDARSVLKEDPPTAPADVIKQMLSNTLMGKNTDIGLLAWKERPARYAKAIEAVITKLKVNQSKIFGGNGSLEGVMYLPYAEADRGLHCAYSIEDGNFNGTIEQVANYFIKGTPYSIPQLSPSAPDIRSLKLKWENVLADKNTILDSVFSEKHDDLCDGVHLALAKHRSQRTQRDASAETLESSGFSAFVAVKCSYDFVWYELGWRYYIAARTTSDYVLEKNGGTYKENCGQVIFLP